MDERLRQRYSEFRMILDGFYVVPPELDQEWRDIYPIAFGTDVEIALLWDTFYAKIKKANDLSSKADELFR